MDESRPVINVAKNLIIKLLILFTVFLFITHPLPASQASTDLSAFKKSVYAVVRAFGAVLIALQMGYCD